MQPHEGEGAKGVLSSLPKKKTKLKHVARLPAAPGKSLQFPQNAVILTLEIQPPRPPRTHIAGTFSVCMYTQTRSLIHACRFWGCIKGILCVFREAL